MLKHPQTVGATAQYTVTRIFFSPTPAVDYRVHATTVFMFIYGKYLSTADDTHRY